ncbi:hypothetical protein D0Z00_001635 [Geotrichum galactomycetum]|uniref:Uncharacterized protein n=1 Tax=Geotrichum galactomycetum TaxID=27317 RepID=A0ACB6V6H1_9ASCO|nr:hypothetical protein D0Z00_001635 [Geotrichum candidum]
MPESTTTAAPSATAAAVVKPIDADTTTKKNDNKFLHPVVALLAELDESSRNLPNSSSNLGTIQLGIQEISKRACALRKDLPNENSTKAHYLLAGSGVNAENIQAELKSFKSQAEPAAQLDTYERPQKEESALLAIEELVQNSAIDYDSDLAKHISLEWVVRKKQMTSLFGIGKNGREAAKGENQLVRSGNNNWSTSIGRAVLGPISGAIEFTDAPSIAPLSYVQAYTEVVRELNQNRLNYPLIKKFHRVSLSLTQSNDVRTRQFQDAWKVIGQIVGTASERQFSSAYLSTKQDSKDAIALRKRIVDGSKRFLERQFLEKLQSKVPGQMIVKVVETVLTKKFNEDGKWVPALEIVDNLPVWAIIYYLVRAGSLKEALTYTQSSLEGFQKLGTSFPFYLKAFVESTDNVLPKNLLDNIRKEFNEQVRFYDEENSDPFKYALYKLIGRCEADKKTFPGIVNTAEDWLWTHLMLIQEDGEGADKYTLQSLQLTVTNFGAKYFNSEGKMPGLYVQVLLMCGLFEKAVHYAYTHSAVDGVHYSIALTYYGLLRPVTNFVQSGLDLLYLNKYDLNELNFARLMGFYTREFRRSDPVDAVEYLILISFNRDQTDLCLEALKELVYETREYATLLGEIGPSGSRLPGAIERRIRLVGETPAKFDAYLREIVTNAAPRAVEDGYIPDAVLLYLLNEDYDRAVDIVNRALGEQLSQTPLGSFISKPRSVTIAATDDAAQLAQHLTAIFNATPRILTEQLVRPFTARTCETLLKIVYARDAFAQGHADLCLQHVDDTGVLVLDPAATIADVRAGAQRAQQQLDPAVVRTLPSLLVMVMRCLNRLDPRDPTVRALSRNCMVYAGLLRARMDREVFAELTNLEIRY